MFSSPRHRTAAAWLLASLWGCAGEPSVQTPPGPLGTAIFEYPEELWDAGVEGVTMLRIHVSETGAADTVTVERSSGQAAFDSAAVQGARALRFTPALRGEVPVAASVNLPVRFDLEVPGPLSPPVPTPSEP